MSFPTILLLAAGVSMDAAAVAAARGLATPVLRLRDLLLLSGLFGAFQVLMPLLGWGFGAHLDGWVARWDHWIVCALLVFLGVRMLREAWSQRGGEQAPPSPDEAFDLRLLLVLAFVTSFDAFAVGITLPLLEAPLFLTLFTFGVTTALCSALGLVLGRHFGALLGARFDALGGLVLIGIGLKILVEHWTHHG